MSRRDWHVDERSAHPYTRLYVAMMWRRRDKEAFEGTANTLAAARERQTKGDAPPGRGTRLLRRVEEREVAGMRVWVVAPRRAAPRVRVFYLHGGGYVHPLTRDYWRLVRALTGRGSAAEVVVPRYPLAPGATVDDVVPRLVQLVQSFDEDGCSLSAFVMGDSAGGALALAIASALRARASTSGTTIARLVLLSPWLDATLDDDQVADLESSDPMLAETGLRAAGRWWAGPRRPADPEVSPVNADLTGLPRTDLFIGQHDILRPAVERFADNAARDDLDLRVHETPAMFHVWMTRAIPEGARTRRQLRALMDA